MEQAKVALKGQGQASKLIGEKSGMGVDKGVEGRGAGGRTVEGEEGAAGYRRGAAKEAGKALSKAAGDGPRK